jgi:hypothetical protein
MTNESLKSWPLEDEILEAQRLGFPRDIAEGMVSQGQRFIGADFGIAKSVIDLMGSHNILYPTKSEKG